jgi:hypothetical protein
LNPQDFPQLAAQAAARVPPEGHVAPPDNGERRGEGPQDHPVLRQKEGIELQFTKDETFHLLDKVEELLPIGAEEWKQVHTYFNKKVDPKRQQTRDGIRQKFNALAAMKVPTGDPSVPQEVWKAKSIRESIYLKCCPVTGQENATAEVAVG